MSIIPKNNSPKNNASPVPVEPAVGGNGLHAGQLPVISEVKVQAKELRRELAAQGQTVGHAMSLERISQRYGYRDWNTCRADITASFPKRLVAGARIKGRYLSQPFTGTILSVGSWGSQLQNSGLANVDQLDLTVDFDQPVDVVIFDSFSNLRKRVRATVGSDGASAAVTSDGQPQFVIRMLI
jgi:hypothetical protein